MIINIRITHKKTLDFVDFDNFEDAIEATKVLEKLDEKYLLKITLKSAC